MLTVQPGPRDRRLLSALLILGVVAVTFYIVQQLTGLFFYFGDILLTFFLAWLLAFIISPIVTRIVDAIPRLPRAVATILVYGAVVLILVVLVVLAAGALASSIADFATRLPDIKSNLPEILAPWQAWLNSLGLGQVDLVAQAEAALGNLDQIAGALVAPLQQIAVASLSVVGTMLIVFFLSIYMVLDRDVVLAFLFRIVPPSYSEEARLLETSVSRSFGGFLRGQALMGFVYFLIAFGTNAAARPPARGPDIGGRRAAPDDPVLRPVRVLGAAGDRRARPPARIRRADAHPDGAGLDRGHERPPAADHAGRRRHPPDRRPRLGAHRRPDRGHPRRHLRDPLRRRRVGVRHGVPASHLGRPVGRGSRRQAARGTRRPAGPHPARARARQRDRHRRAGRNGATDLAEPDGASAPT